VPILTGFLASVFAVVFGYLAKRLTLGLAAAAAFVASAGAAYLAVKAVLWVSMAAVGSVVPAGFLSMMMAFFPSNVAECITAVLLADTVVTHYDQFRAVLGNAFLIAKG
jgi:biotin transporter BioY